MDKSKQCSDGWISEIAKLRLRSKLSDYILATIFIFATAALTANLAMRNEVTTAGSIHVLDGDSIRLDGKEIRLKGIDAPEGRQRCGTKDDNWPCGTRARKYLRDITKRKKVECSGHEHDRFDRLLAVCRVGEMVLNSEMVAQGWAVAFGAYEREEAQAEKAKRGIWRSEFTRPQEWRRQGNPKPENEGPRNLIQQIFGGD